MLVNSVINFFHPLVNGTQLTISTQQTARRRADLLFFTPVVPFDWNISLTSVVSVPVDILKCVCLCCLQTSVQLGFQCTLPEASVAPDHFHDNQDDHWVSCCSIDCVVIFVRVAMACVHYISAMYTAFTWFFFYLCVSASLSSMVPLLQLIYRGSPMSFEDSNRIIPVFYLFSSLFSHSLISVHDSEFFGHELEGNRHNRLVP